MDLKRVAILLHLGNFQLWCEFKRYLTILTSPSIIQNYHVDIFISYQEENPDQLNEIRSLFPQAYLLKTLLGCDIGGKIMSCYQIILSKLTYDYILSIHTKTDDEWRWESILPLCGSEQIVLANLNIFNTHPEIGMIGAQPHIVPLLNYNYNEKILEQMDNMWNIGYKTNLQSIQFVRGTIFWMRWDILSRFITEKTLDLLAEYTKLQPGYITNSEPSWMHSWERLYAILTYHYKYRVHGVPRVNVPNPSRRLGIPEDFDAKIYLQLHPDVAKHYNNSEWGATEHYIKHGKNEGRVYKIQNDTRV